MEGVDMHIDVNIGKQLSALGHTLTTLAAFEEEEEEEEDEDEHNSEREDTFLSSLDLTRESTAPNMDGQPSHLSSSQESVVTLRRQKSEHVHSSSYSVPAAASGEGRGPKKTMLEKEMQERANCINELKSRGAPQSQIEEERKKLQELENLAFKVRDYTHPRVPSSMILVHSVHCVCVFRISEEIGSKS